MMLTTATKADEVYDLLRKTYPEDVLSWVKDATWTMRQRVPLADIKMARRPGGRDPKKVDAIVAAIEAGEEMEPVVLVDTSDGLEIADGYHRTLAYQKSDKKTIKAWVGTGAGDHGPWEREMHDAKLNKTQRTIELTGQKYADMVMDWYGRRAPQDVAAYNPLGGTDTQACANCLFFMTPNGCTVVEDWPMPISPTGLSKFWTEPPSYEQEPLRVIIVEEDDDDEMSKALKAVWSTAFVNDLPDSSFAVILPGGEKDDDGKTTPRSLRKLPYKDADGKVDMPHLRNALSRLPQTDLTASQRTSAERKLHAAARAAGMDMDEGDKSILGRFFGAIKTFFDHEYRNDTGGALPKLDGPSGMVLFKDLEGEWRWFAWVSNKWRDRDGEIIEDAAHKDFVDYLDGGGAMPEAWLWHTPGTRWGVADWADYTDGFLAMAGTVDAGKEAIAEALAKERLGVSHGFLSRYSAKDVIGWYRSHEISPLPPMAAANAWTSMELVRKEAAMAFSPAKRAFLETKLGKDRVDALEQSTGDLAKSLSDLGIDYKDLPEDPAPAAVLSEKDVRDLSEAMVKAITESGPVKALSDSVAAIGSNVEQLAAGAKSLDERIKALERTDAEKVAEHFKARIAGVPGTLDRPSEASKTMTEKEKEAAKAAEPNLDGDPWLKKALA